MARPALLLTFLSSKVTRQTGVLFGSQMLVLLASVFTGMLNSRYLGPEGYGIYSFVLATITFVDIYFGFGFGSAGARLMATSVDENEEREIAACIIVFGAGITLAFSTTVFLLSFVIDKIFRTDVKNIMMSASLLAGVLPFQQIMVLLYRGSNRINGMALFSLFPKLWYLGSIVLVVAFWSLNPLVAVMLNLSGIVVASVVAVSGLRPTFRKAGEHLRRTWIETKEYGFNVYLGRIADTSTYKLDKLFIASFVNTISVGYYTLASTIVSPMANLSRAISNSLFKRFTAARKIDKRVVVFNFLWLLACVLFLALARKIIVVTLFTEEFLPVVSLILPLAIAGFFQGMYTPFNMFLAAHRRGKELRFISFSEAVFNVLGNLILIRLFGAMGAAIASAIAKGIELGLNVYFYRKTVLQLKMIAHDTETG